MGFIEKIMGKVNTAELNKINKLVDKIISLEEKYSKLSDKQLKEKSEELKLRVREEGENLDRVLVEAFALAREADFRVLNKKPFRVQIMGGIALHQGRIAEMKTGEGKTLTATLPAYLNALSGKGVHVITVNDYLARVGVEEMGRVYNFLGLTTGIILPQMPDEEKKEAYKADITYGINSEFGFDYLRDNMVTSLDRKVQRGLNYCIIDEVDSILIDEARTPLIISGKGKEASKMYKFADYFIKSLDENKDYEIDHKLKAITLTEEGYKKAEEYYQVENFTDIENFTIKHHTIQALRANYIMNKEINYIVRDGEVLIVDEFTGRVMEGRRFSDGLHEAIEAKEGLEQKEENSTFASITYQNFFKMYKKLSGMTGTAKTEEEEFNEIFSTDVVVVPTNKTVVRVDNKDKLYKTEYEKFKAVVKDIKATNGKGQPILIGTSSIDKSEILSFMLKREGVKHSVLNAKHHAKEATIVAKAGEVGAVTIATNMAGRGTDIILGEGVQELGGLKVIGTERHESVRIDNQLRGRSGRQGDVGESIFYLSLEDDLLANHMSEGNKKLMEKAITQVADGEEINIPETLKVISSAQKEVEGDNFATRKNVVKYDDVLNAQREVIYAQRDKVMGADEMKTVIFELANQVIRGSISKDTQELKSTLKQIFNIEYKGESIKGPEICKWYITNFIERYELKQKNMDAGIERIIKFTFIKIIDSIWVEHLQAMEVLKQYIVLQQYKQQDPVQAYMLQGGDIFNEAMFNIKKKLITYISTTI